VLVFNDGDYCERYDLNDEFHVRGNIVVLFPCRPLCLRQPVHNGDSMVPGFNKPFSKTYDSAQGEALCQASLLQTIEEMQASSVRQDSFHYLPVGNLGALFHSLMA